MARAPQKQVVFIQNAIPPLRDGVYEIDATQTIPGQSPGSFTAKATLVAQGERFSIRPTEIASLFPPNLANGEFDGVLPHVVLTRRTLPWEREPDTPKSSNVYKDSPWLAILVCDDATAPQLQKKTAKDLVEKDQLIKVFDSQLTGKGTLDANILSYGAALLGELGYGETPDDATTVIDLPLATFNQIAPAAADLQYLAHIREVDTEEGPNSDATIARYAIVVANRITPSNGVVRAFLVSLEGMADYLPASDGTQSTAIGKQIDTVRLIAYQSWSFTVNDMDQKLEKLLANLNTPPPGGKRITTLTLPIAGDAPSPAQLAQAMANQAAGTLSAADATMLMQNALLMGYVPLDHHLRRGGRTVSFYRGPLVPFAVPASAPPYYSGPDAANGYNPQSGMFDVSYGAAWQLGQLLALQSAGMANQLYQWKRQVKLQQAIAAEHQLLAASLQGATVFPSVLGRRAAAIDEGPPPLPPDVVTWFGNLVVMLQGVPFNYLVPDERLLPPESIRFFYIDENWIDALVDGAFSIGRAVVSEKSLEARHAPMVRRLARAHGGRRPANRRAAAGGGSGIRTGFVIRSQAVAGWPKLRIIGFKDARARDQDRIEARHFIALSRDTLMCLFDDVLAAVYVREPPEQQHHGVEGSGRACYVPLRSVVGGPETTAPGQQYETSPVKKITPCDPDGTHPWACIPMRADQRTVMVASAADTIKDRLTKDFGQALPHGFTSAEFALELTKGVVEVEYRR